MLDKGAIVPTQPIESQIYIVRGQRVMLDADLANLYGVATSRLNEQVKRNRERFPPDFLFRLTREEFQVLISQLATSKGRGGRRKLPLVFTEHGAIMAASVLNSERAIEMSVHVVRAFIKLRDTLAGHKKLARKLEELEQRVDDHDHDISDLVLALKQLTSSPDKEPKPIGFRTGTKAGEGKTLKDQRGKRKAR